MEQRSAGSNSESSQFINVCFLFFMLILCHSCLAGDWPTFRADGARSAVSADSIEPELFLQWTYRPVHAPKPAWPMPSEELPRMHNDNAYHAVAAGDSLYFGSSVTNCVHALDVAQGTLRWTFRTQGPVRFAPTVSGGRVYVGSDDGYVYCLDADKGALIWKYRAGPSEEKVIGNGRMISLWPVRTGTLVDRGVVYFAAGVFPYEGLYICALKAEDGSVVWRNDVVGDRAHELEYGGLSPHGYPLVSEEILYVPSGRSMPAAFDRMTGELLHTTSPGGKRGGTWALVDRNQLISGVDVSGTPNKVIYDGKTGKKTGEAFAWFPGIDMVTTYDFAYILTRDGIFGINRSAYSKATQEAEKQAETRKKLQAHLAGLEAELKDAPAQLAQLIQQQIDELNPKISSILAAEAERLKKSAYEWQHAGQGFKTLIVAGDVLFAGGDNKVIALDMKTGEQRWQASVQGQAVGLVAAAGRLTVSTDKGPVYCFGPEQRTQAREVKLNPQTYPYAADPLQESYRRAAATILQQSGCKKGYCLILDCDQGRLACELAQNSELKIVGIETDPVKLALARRNLEGMGLLGSRVVVESWDLSSLPDYFANLVVSDRMLITGKTDANRKAVQRVLRPYGGMAFLDFDKQKKTFEKAVVRGALEGAGHWTQQYGNPENTACSADELVNGPLGILWYGEPGPQGMVERHARAQSPVALNGRLFVEGEELIMAIDAFNGTQLWQRALPGAVRVKIKADSGNLVATEGGLYVAALDQCYRLDPVTGRTMRVYDLPPSSDGMPRRWGYVSVKDGILYGSTAMAMTEEYGALWKALVDQGKWRPAEDIPERYRKQYASYRKQYTDPMDLFRAFQRGGTMFRYMTSFARGGEFLQTNAVTDSLMVSDRVFALDTETGKSLWVHQGEKIANITVTLGDGKLFFAESACTDKQRARALKRRKKLISTGTYKEREGVREELREKKGQLAALEAGDKPFNKSTLSYLISSLEAELFQEEYAEGSLSYADADIRLAVALDARTGERLWKKPVDLTGCCGDKMGTAYSDGMLFFFGNHGNHDAWRFREGGMKWRRITALSAESGDMLWSQARNYRTRPVIVGDKIILEPRACDLRTGETIMRTHPVTAEQVPWEFLRPGHTCGITAASEKGLFYRSACTAFYDLEQDRGVTVFGGYRPGCAISVIPASGLLLSPEAAAGCTCSYPIRCSMAMQRKPQRAQPWTVYVTPGALQPVQHFAINLGAVADMKDNEGTVWFSYPNVNTGSYNHFPNYGVKFDLQEDIWEGMGYFSHDFKGVDVQGTDRPWLFTSGCVGLKQCTIPLLDKQAGSKGGLYTVRLGFMARPEDRAGKRVFDVMLQGKPVLKDFDICQSAGDCSTVVIREFQDVAVQDDLVLELEPRTPLEKDRAPVLNFIEVERTDRREVARLTD
jgi:outer membrane protein assembly factor BamB